MVVIRISQQGVWIWENGKVKEAEVFGTAEFGLCIAQVVGKWNKKGMLTGLCRIPPCSGDSLNGVYYCRRQCWTVSQKAVLWPGWRRSYLFYLYPLCVPHGG